MCTVKSGSFTMCCMCCYNLDKFMLYKVLTALSVEECAHCVQVSVQCWGVSHVPGGGLGQGGHWMRAAAAVWHATKSLVSQLSDNSTNYPGVRSRTNMGGPEEMLSLLFGKHCLVIIFKFIRPPSWFLSVTCPGTFSSCFATSC